MLFYPGNHLINSTGGNCDIQGSGWIGADYSERMTRYQVEHIAGEKGSRTRYIPPKCDTLQAH